MGDFNVGWLLGKRILSAEAGGNQRETARHAETETPK
jgi:hypothetical protein